MRTRILFLLLLVSLSTFAQPPLPPPPPVKGATNKPRVIFFNPSKIAADSLFSLRTHVFGERKYYQYAIRTPDGKPLYAYGAAPLLVYLAGKLLDADASSKLGVAFLADSTMKYGEGRGPDFDFGPDSVSSDHPVVWFGTPPVFSKRYAREQAFKAKYQRKTVTGVVDRISGSTAGPDAVRSLLLQTGDDLLRLPIPSADAARLFAHVFPGDVVSITLGYISFRRDTGEPLFSIDRLVKDGETMILRNSVQVTKN